MNNILYPTDFSAHSVDVLLYALELANSLNARLVVFHTYGKPKFSAEGTPKPESGKNEMMEILSNFVALHKEEKYKNVAIDYIVNVGFPIECIFKASSEQEIDLIVMGMASKDDLAGNYLGSVSRGVLKKVNCPVLVVPTNYHYKKPGRIAYATNFLFQDIGALNILKKWGHVFDSTIHCLHTAEFENEMKEAEINMKILEAEFKGAQITHFDLVKGDLIHGAQDYIESNNIEMLAMLSHKRTLFERILEGSNAQRIARKINIPLLVLKGKNFNPSE